MSVSRFISRGWGRIRTILKHHQFKNIAKSATVYYSAEVYNPDNLYMAENTNIDAGAIIMNTRAKLIMKKNSGAAVGLLVITGEHMSMVGTIRRFISNEDKDKMDANNEFDRDITVEEDVWIASNVTLLKGAAIGRGAIVGSGSVVRTSVPPYSVVIGNPAKVVGFVFTPEEIIEHEEMLYPPEERLPRELLEKNYEKYFLKRTKEIKSIVKL